MQALRKDLEEFANQLSGTHETEGEEKQRENYNKGLWTSVGSEWVPRTDWRLQEPYVTGPFNEWVYNVFESTTQLMRELHEDNVYLIEERFRRLKKDYYQMKNQPKRLYGGVAVQYEKAFNKNY